MLASREARHLRNNPVFQQAIRATVVDEAAMPWITPAPQLNAALVKYLRADPARDEIVMLVKAPAGTVLPTLHHSGSAFVYTLQGRWKYRELDWLASPGSSVFVPSASRLTVEVLDADILTLSVVVGDLLLIGPDEEVLAVENWKSAVDRYQAYCRTALIEPRDLTA